MGGVQPQSGAAGEALGDGGQGHLSRASSFASTPDRHATPPPGATWKTPRSSRKDSRCNTLERMSTCDSLEELPCVTPLVSSASQALEECPVFEGRYALKEFLGYGTFGAVHRCTRNEDDEPFAVKVVDLEQDEEVMEAVVRHELIAMRRAAGHPGIVQLHQAFRSATEQHFFFVMEFVAGDGNLGAHLATRWEPLMEKDAAHVVRQLADALAFCHMRGVAHLDMKPHNVLIAEVDIGLEEELDGEGRCAWRTREQLRVKLCDFGSAFLLGRSSPSVRRPVGTPGYSAPELADKHSEYDAFKADAFSLGMLAYVMVCLSAPVDPFVDRGYHAHQRWPLLSSEAQLFLNASMVHSPKRRVGISELRKYAWIAGDGPPESITASERTSSSSSSC